MALVAAVGLTMGQGEAKPKGALALIFGIVGAYLVLLFLFQSRDLSKAEAADPQATSIEPAELSNPATLDEPALWAAMATKPIDVEAVRARKAVWSTSRSSIRLGMLICALIFVSVPPIYLLDTFVPFMIGAPLIALTALWKSAGLLAAGGDLDRAYDNIDLAMEPLELSVTERPEITIEPKSVAPYRLGPGIHGAVVMEGKRHGRSVKVRLDSTAKVVVGADAPEFAFKARDGRLKAEDGAPEAVRELLKGVPNSTRWNGVRGSAGPEGIVVERKRVASGEWLLDLWLAERLAETVGPGLREVSVSSAG